MEAVDVIGRKREYDGWLGFKRRFIYPFRWFYQAHIWGLRFRLRNVRMFASAVWHWDSCDYSPTLRMMEIAFREISRLHKEHGYGVSSPKISRQTLIASEICRRLAEDEYAEIAGYDSDKWTMMSDRQKRRVFTHGEYLAKQDAEYFGKLFRFVRWWWN